jgi:hypothetical protein
MINEERKRDPITKLHKRGRQMKEFTAFQELDPEIVALKIELKVNGKA